MPLAFHCAEFADEATAAEAARALLEFRSMFTQFEESMLQEGRIQALDETPAPLTAFAAKHGFDVPGVCEVLLKGSASDVMEVLHVNKVVFFYASAFDLGGKAIELFFRRAKAVKYSRNAACIVIESHSPEESAESLASFLNEEDFEGQYTLVHSDAARVSATGYSIRLANSESSSTLCFDDSGVQDWALAACLPQLDGESPRLEPDTRSGWRID